MVAKKLRCAKLFFCNNVGGEHPKQGLVERVKEEEASGLQVVATAEEQAARSVLILLARQLKRPAIMSLGGSIYVYFADGTTDFGARYNSLPSIYAVSEASITI